MLQVWVMPGFGVTPVHDDPVAEFHRLVDSFGYTAIVATNCEQDYLRALRLRDVVHVTKVIEAVSAEKKTALGRGFFLTTRFEFTDQNGEPVARMLHRVLKFIPGTPTLGKPSAAPAVAAARRPRPNLTQDNAFFFEAAKAHRLLIQRCTDCLRLRHPPTAACAHCGCLRWDTVESSGRGSLFSFTVVKLLAKPEVRDAFAKVGVETGSSTPEALASFILAEREKWAQMVKLAGIEPE